MREPMRYIVRGLRSMRPQVSRSMRPKYSLRDSQTHSAGIAPTRAKAPDPGRSQDRGQVLGGRKAVRRVGRRRRLRAVLRSLRDLRLRYSAIDALPLPGFMALAVVLTVIAAFGVPYLLSFLAWHNSGQ